LEQPNKGLFGLIGSKPAKVRVALLAPDPVDAAKGFLQSIFDVINIAPAVEITATEEKPPANDTQEKIKNRDCVLINLRGSELGMLIGKHGQTLDALQYLLNIVANKESSKRVKILLDVENYRKRREETLTRLAQRLADRVKRRREKVVLEPMNPQERKIIHMTLQNDDRIITYSEGDEPFRRVVVALKR
jgi:spoIIIJ-associated protein